MRRALRLCFCVCVGIFVFQLATAFSFAQTSHAPLPPESFQRAMIFVDGTNVFYRFQDLRLVCMSFYDLLKQHVGRRDLVRIYWYTIEEKFNRAVAQHGSDAFRGIHRIFGTGVPRSGDVAEKGVDALLVADLIYHAAHKNIDYALLVSIDRDFVYTIRRVHDFGCRTGILAIGADAHEDLKLACDKYTMVSRADLLKSPSLIREAASAVGPAARAE
jgi:uncharacterized LabA/DUF88 family protein